MSETKNHIDKKTNANSSFIFGNDANKAHTLISSKIFTVITFIILLIISIILIRKISFTIIHLRNNQLVREDYETKEDNLEQYNENHEIINPIIDNLNTTNEGKKSYTIDGKTVYATDTQKRMPQYETDKNGRVICSLSKEKPDINLNDYLYVYCEGYNLVGDAKIGFDYGLFYKDTGQIATIVFGDLLDNLLHSNIDLDQTSYLKNGDIITLHYDEIDKDILGDNVKYGDVSFVVEGLKEADEYDFFDDIYVSFYSENSKGKVQILGDLADACAVTKNDSGYYPYYIQEMIPPLSNGDNVTIIISPDFSDKEDYIQRQLIVRRRIAVGDNSKLNSRLIPS